MTKTLKIEGMTCMHCVGAVTKELERLNGVDKAVVDLEGKKAVVEISNDIVTDENLCDAVEEAGYQVIAIE